MADQQDEPQQQQGTKEDHSDDVVMTRTTDDPEQEETKQDEQQQHDPERPSQSGSSHDGGGTTTNNNTDDDGGRQEKEPSLVSSFSLLIPNAPPLYFHHHLQYMTTLVSKLEESTNLEGAYASHLKLSGVYWTIGALSILQTPAEIEQSMQVSTAIVDWIFTCYDTTSGGFGGNSHQEPHVLYTLSAIQLLAMADTLDDPRFNVELTVNYLATLQQLQLGGCFVGDHSNSIQEIDTRFSYCAIAALAILHRLDAIDVDMAANYITQCHNEMDGGYGTVIGCESHAGQIFCCVATLSILQRMDLVKVDLLAWWLCERQVDSGGLNGRPEKQADVCYSWWILSSLSILGKVKWINTSKLAQFILNCQDDDDGGIADRPDDMPDIFHTFFGLAGLSLLGYLHHDNLPVKCRTIDPVYALPTDVVRRLNLPGQVIVSRIDSIDERLSHYTVIQE